MLIDRQPSPLLPATPAVVALLRSPLRGVVEARVVRQLVQALMFEGVLPFAHDAGTFRFTGCGADGRPVAYEARGVVAQAFGLIRLGPQPVLRDAGDGRLAPVDLQAALAEVVAPIGNVARLTGFAEELEQTLLKDLQAQAQPVPASLASRDDYDALEGDVMDAHAVHPCYKSRIGFSLADNRRYGPEFKAPVVPEWLAVRAGIASTAWSRGIDPAAFLRAELGAATLAAFSERLAAVEMEWEDVALIPVHPWQWTERVATLVAPELASGAILWLGQGSDTYRAQQSIRTLANVDTPHRHALKLSLGIVNTSTSRILARHTVLNAPHITDWLRALLAADEIDCVLLGEVGGASLEHEALGPLRSSRGYGQLAAIWRESVHVHLRPGEAAMPFNALSHVQRDGRPLVADWLDRYGTAAWTVELLRVAVTPIVHLLFAHGIGLESHAQNIVLFHRHGWPTRIALKDFHDGVRYAPHLLARPDLAPALHPVPASHAAINRNSFLETDRPDAVRDYSADAFFFVALGELGLFLDRQFGLPERRFWDMVAAVVDDYRARHPEHAARIRAFDLDAATFEVEALTRRRLFGDAEPQVLQVPNPLVGRTSC
jgi:siderophore synthetase component